MAVTRGAPNEGGSKQTVASTPTTTIATPTSATSLFGSSPPKDVAAPSKNLKRKANDANLKVIDIDVMPDLTLVVGTPSHPKGQKAFRVSKASFRNVSIVWMKMMSSHWAESEQSEISFPDDSCDAFLIVLRIAHFQLTQLPDKLSREELVDIALLADKYQVENAVRIGMDFKQWLKPHHQPGAQWPIDRHLQDFAVIVSAFKLQVDYDCLVKHLAMYVEVDESGGYFYKDEKQGKVPLRSDLPPRVSGEIDRIRSSILSAWVAICTVSLNDVAKSPQKPTLCKKPLCVASRIGILLMGLQVAGLYPSPSNTDVMRRSVVEYWKDIKNIGASYEDHGPCDERKSSYNKHVSSCSFVKCFGDFGVITDAELILQRYAHKDVRKKWRYSKIDPELAVTPKFDLI